MAYVQSFDAALSMAELNVLDFLDRKWPVAATVTQDVIVGRGVESLGRAAFVEAIQTLSDNGLILYEAFLVDASVGVRFTETMITARGKAALRQCNVDA